MPSHHCTSFLAFETGLYCNRLRPRIRTVTLDRPKNQQCCLAYQPRAIIVSPIRTLAVSNLKCTGETFEDDLNKLFNNVKLKEDWRLIKHACYAWNATFPKRRRYERLLSEAELVTARPIVTFQGAIELLGEGDEMSVNLKVQDPKTKIVYNYWVKEGQTFHYQVLKLERIRIEADGIEMEYLPIHQLWVVPT